MVPDTIGKRVVLGLTIAICLRVFLILLSGPVEWIGARSEGELIAIAVGATVVLFLLFLAGRARVRFRRRRRFAAATEEAQERLLDPVATDWARNMSTRTTAGNRDGLPTQARWDPPAGPTAG